MARRDDVAGSAVETAGSLLIRPKLVLIAAIVFLLIFVVTGIGSCASALVGGLAAASNTEETVSAYDMSGAEYQIYAFFKDKGYGDTQIAAVLGNQLKYTTFRCIIKTWHHFINDNGATRKELG